MKKPETISRAFSCSRHHINGAMGLGMVFFFLRFLDFFCFSFAAFVNDCLATFGFLPPDLPFFSVDFFFLLNGLGGEIAAADF